MSRATTGLRRPTRRKPPARAAAGLLVAAALTSFAAAHAAPAAQKTSYRDYVCDSHDAEYDATKCADVRRSEGTAAFQFFMGLVWLESVPFLQPYLAGEDHYHLPFFAGWSLMPYPYARGAPGYSEPVAGASGEARAGYAVPVGEQRTLAVQIAIEGMPAHDGPGRVQARAKVLTGVRVDFDLACALYFDRSDASGNASAALGSLHAAFRLGQTEHTQFRAGLGARQWTDARGSTFGVDGLYAADLFWPRPITTSLELTGGSLGSGGALGLRATLGAMVQNVELYAGYDATWLFGADDLPSLYLGGPVAGARVYF